MTGSDQIPQIQLMKICSHCLIRKLGKEDDRSKGGTEKFSLEGKGRALGTTDPFHLF